MEPGVLCLQWNEFQTNLRSSLKDLRNSVDFSDVTLVCEDGQRLDAHRVILASSSAFFKDLLLKINQPHPVIFMRALTHATMMNFIYLGEAEVRKEKLDDFLSLAGELGVKGMTNTVPNPIQECMRYHELFLMPFIGQFLLYPLSGTVVELLYSFRFLCAIGTGIIVSLPYWCALLKDSPGVARIVSYFPKVILYILFSRSRQYT